MKPITLNVISTKNIYGKLSQHLISSKACSQMHKNTMKLLITQLLVEDSKCYIESEFASHCLVSAAEIVCLMKLKLSETFLSHGTLFLRELMKWHLI